MKSIRKVGTSKYQMNEIDAEDSSSVSKLETEGKMQEVVRLKEVESRNRSSSNLSWINSLLVYVQILRNCNMLQKERT
jgi:hypothetical protein